MTPIVVFYRPPHYCYYSNVQDYVRFMIAGVIVDEKIILSDFVAFLGVIPEVTGVGNEVAGMVNQRVVDRDDAQGKRIKLSLHSQKVQTRVLQTGVETQLL